MVATLFLQEKEPDMAAEVAVLLMRMAEPVVPAEALGQILRAAHQQEVQRIRALEEIINTVTRVELQTRAIIILVVQEAAAPLKLENP